MSLHSEVKSFQFSGSDMRAQISLEGLLNGIQPTVLQDLLDATVCIRQVNLVSQAGIDFLSMAEQSDTQLGYDRGDWMPRLHVTAGHGTGTVIGVEQVGEREEYLILTNNHVATQMPIHSFKIADMPLNVTQLTINTRLLLVDDLYDNRKNRTQLELIARDVDSDAALLRTVSVEEDLAIFPYRLGPSGPIDVGMPLFTAGFPLGENQIATDGKILATDAIDFEVTPAPNKHYLVTLPIDPGQSGSPVLTVRVNEAQDGLILEPELIGLVYAGAGELDTVRMVTPWENFAHIVEKRETRPSKRPSLYTPFDNDGIDEIITGGERFGNLFDVGNLRYHLQKDGKEYTMTAMPYDGSMPIYSQRLKIRFTADEGAVEVSSISYLENGYAERVLDLEEFPDLQRRWNMHATGVLNLEEQLLHFGKLADDGALSAEMKEQSYIADVLNKNIYFLARNQEMLISDLFERDRVSFKFLAMSQE